MEVYSVAAGTALPLTTTLTDGTGLPLNYADPAPPLSARVWPGGARPVSFVVAASWSDPTTGTVDLAITAGQTAGLKSGRYRGELELDDPDLGRMVVWEWSIEVLTSAGNEPEAPTYGSFDDLLGEARGWLREMQTGDDQAGFGRERGQARSWLEERIINAAPRYLRTRIRALLRADRLIVEPWVIEVTTLQAVARICRGQLGISDDERWLKRANAAHNRSSNDVLCHTAEIAEVAGGPPVYRINLGAGSLR